MFTLHASLALFFVLHFACGDPTSSELEIMNWEAPEYLKTEYPYYLSGNDYDGSPVFVVEMGKWDLKSAVEAGPEKTAELDKWMTKAFLHWRSAGNEAVGSPGAAVIADFEGMDIEQLGNAGVIQLLLKQFPKVRQIAQLPGFKKVYIINANYLVKEVYELGKPKLGDVANIVDSYGTSSAKWKPLLLKDIPGEGLPASYGGSESHQPVKIFG